MRKTPRFTLSARALLGLTLLAAATACASNDTVLQNQQLMRTVKIAEVERLQPAETVAGCAERALPRAADPAARLDPGAWQRMQDYSREHQGVGLIVMVDGQVVGESYRPGAGPQTHTQSQSMHKSIVGLAYGAAIRDRLIGSVNDPAANYLPEWRGDARGALPLRSFLTMSSPLTNFSVGKQEPLALALIYSDAINAAALATPIVPGTPAPFAYKNVDAQIAGLALERAIQRGTGQRYAEWLSKSLWCPLGNGPATLWLERAGGSPRYYAGLQTGLRDWARVGQMIADGGRVGERQVLPAAWIVEATAPSADNPQYGYLMWRGTPWAARRQYNQQTSVTVPHSAPYAVDDLVFFDGFGGQRVYVSPSRRLVIARTGETDLGFDDAVLPNLALAGLRPDERSEAIYRQRLAAMFDGGETNYEPRETVPGAPAWRPWPVAGASQRTIRDDALNAATAYAAARKSSAFLVWHRGQVQAAAYFGNTQPASLLVSKSLSKPMTAIAIGRAIALGKIHSVDQPVADFLPEWKGTPKAAILLRHLLDMRSGLLQQSFVRDPESPLNRAYLDPDHGRYLINDYPLTDAPGSRYVYSNASAELVALVIERSTGMRYAEFIGREVLAPIGAPGGQVWLNRPGGLAHSGCCMLLPAESWLRLGVLLLNDGMHEGRALLPAGFVRDMTTATPQNPHYGLGVWVAGAYVQRRGFAGPGVQRGPQVLHSEPYLDRSLFLFDGNANQTVYVSPATNMVILRLGDTPPAAQEWDNSQLPNLLIRGAVVP